MHTKGISIIILTLNGANHMVRLLDTFFATNTYQPVEIIIVDHGSTDNTSEVVSRYATVAFIRLVRLGKNHSFASSCNLGAGKAGYPYLLFLNNDIVYTSDVLPAAAAKMDDLSVGGVGVRLDDAPQFVPPGKEPGVQHTGIAFEWDPQKGFHRPVQIRHKTQADANTVGNGFYPAVTGAFLLCRKTDFNALGGFCEEYDYGFEDIDFCLQLGTRLHKKCWCINDISLQHLEAASRELVPSEVEAARRQNNDSVFKRRMGEHVKRLPGNEVQEIAPIASKPAAPSAQPQAPSAVIPAFQAKSASLNVLFVLYQTIESNGGLHVQLHADRLKSQGSDCLIAVPANENKAKLGKKTDTRARTFAHVEEKGPVFSDGRGPDIIHAWTPREIVRRFCEKILKKYPCPLIIHLEDNEEYLTEVTVGQPFSKLKKLPKEELDKSIPLGRYHPYYGPKFLKRAQGLTMIIDSLGHFNTKNAPSLVLPPPVDERLFYPRPLNLALRRAHDIPDDHLVLAYTGNVHDGNKDEVHELYKAVDTLNQQGYPTVLLRTGLDKKGVGIENWDRQFEKHLGWVKREQIPDILAAADILVQPGKTGPFNDQRIPSKLPEFFAMGRPVILPKTNLGLKLAHGKEAYVLERADAEGITAAVKEIFSNKTLAGNLAVGGVAFVRSTFDALTQSRILKQFISDRNLG